MVTTHTAATLPQHNFNTNSIARENEQPTCALPETLLSLEIIKGVEDGGGGLRVGEEGLKNTDTDGKCDQDEGRDTKGEGDGERDGDSRSLFLKGGERKNGDGGTKEQREGERESARRRGANETQMEVHAHTLTEMAPSKSRGEGVLELIDALLLDECERDRDRHRDRDRDRERDRDRDGDRDSDRDRDRDRDKHSHRGNTRETPQVPPRPPSRENKGKKTNSASVTKIMQVE